MNENHPMFTIVTVVLNGENCIEATLKSVIDQTYRNIELIVIDGGSLDSTVELIRKYENYILYWISEPDKGVYDAMNKGVEAAKGEYLFFLNCGDRLASPNVLEDVAEYVRRNSPDILYGGIYLEKERSKVRFTRKIESDFDLFRHTICHQAIFASKKVYDAVGLFQPFYKICADREWLLRSIKKHGFRLSYMDIPISVYDHTGISSREKASPRLECLVMNFVHFDWKFYPYLYRQFRDKVKRTGEKLFAL